jgi:hypothetical protein
MTAKALGPGEVAGPAVAVTLQIRNGSGKRIDLSATSVELADSTGAPGLSMTDDPANPFSDELEPGATATGTYVFRIPTSNRKPITVSVRYSTEAPIVLFVGDAK